MQDSYSRIQQVFESNWERFITTLMIEGLKDKKERTVAYLVVKKTIVLWKKLKELFNKSRVRKTNEFIMEQVAFDEVAEKRSEKDEEDDIGNFTLVLKWLTLLRISP